MNGDMNEIVSRAPVSIVHSAGMASMVHAICGCVP